MKSGLKDILNDATKEDLDRLVAYYKIIKNKKTALDYAEQNDGSSIVSEQDFLTQFETGNQPIVAGGLKKIRTTPAIRNKFLSESRQEAEQSLSTLYLKLLKEKPNLLVTPSVLIKIERELFFQLNQGAGSGMAKEYYKHLIYQCIANQKRNVQQAFLHSREISLILKKAGKKVKDEWWLNYYCELATSYCLSNRYHNAFKCISRAAGFATPRSKEEIRVMELLFVILVKLNNVSLLKDLINRSGENNHIGRNDFLTSQWRYYAGIMYLTNEKYSDAIRFFQNKCDFKRSDRSWAIQSLLLEVVCRLENGAGMWFDYRYEAIRKCVNRYSRQPLNPDGEYVNAIFDMMKKLRKHDYDFAVLMKVNYSAYLQLSKMGDEYIKRPGTAPLYDFAKWFREGAKNRKILG